MERLINRRKNFRLCFVGNMLGRNGGFNKTQGQIIAELFANDGYEVDSISAKINRPARMLEIIAVLIKNHRKISLVVLDVYSGLNLYMASIVGLLCRLSKLPLIMVMRGGNLPRFAERNPRKIRRILQRADMLVAPSRFLAEKLRRMGAEIKVIPNVIDIKNYPFRKRRNIEPNLFWMRSFHPVYDPQMAVRVLAELKKSFPRATLTMAGVDKGLEFETRSLAAELSLTDSIRFPGFLDMERKIAEYSHADIFINTNRVDNMPVAVIEAGAMGLPIVATQVGGLPYLLTSGENGLLVPGGEVAAMSEAIRSLLEDPEMTARLSIGGRQLAERCAWENVRYQWEELFEQVLLEGIPKSSAPLIRNKFVTDKP